jgi:hypothetical protein
MRSTLLVFAAVAALIVVASAAPARDGDKGGAPPKPAPPQPGGLAQPGVLPPGAQPFQPLDPQKMQEMMQQQMAKMFGLKIPPPAVKWGGMILEPAADALLDQLNLPGGKGMIIASVEADSAAAEAGLKKYDLVIKVNQDAVPADARELLKALGDSKSEPVDLVVIRKGKEQTLKAVKLPQAALATPPGPAGLVGPGVPPIGLPLPPPKLIGPPGVGIVPLPGGGQGDFSGAKIGMSRDKEQFSADFEKDKLTIKIRGKVDGNQPKVEEISVQEGKDEAKKYQKVEDVPPAQREVVNRLVQLVGGTPGALGTLPGLLPPAPPAPPVQPDSPEKK